MKTVIAVAMILAVATLIGCQTSPRGGNMAKNEGFTISVPNFSTEVKQGQLQMVTISVQRDSLFKQDVKLEVKAPKGIGIEPKNITVKASDKPDVQLQVAAPKDAAIGEYPVVVKGVPETGEPTSVGFTVKVIAP